MHEAGWEFIGHGVHQKALNHADGEESLIVTALDMIQSFTGTRPRGWLSPGLRESFDTPEILKRQGVDYVCDWVVDDVPRWMSTREGPLLSVPYNVEINDSIIYAIEKHSSPEMLLRLENTLRLFEREAKTHPRVLAIGLHPHLIGVPHRFEYLERMLDVLMKSPQVTFMTGSQIADWYTAQVPPPQA
jgi:peptidoglycan/xylan/chitin deacetylase (PgdA/CDA1 family)